MGPPSLADLVGGGPSTPGGMGPDETTPGAMGQEAAAAEVMDAIKAGKPNAVMTSLANFVRLIIADEDRGESGS